MVWDNADVGDAGLQNHLHNTQHRRLLLVLVIFLRLKVEDQQRRKVLLFMLDVLSVLTQNYQYSGGLATSSFLH